MKNAYHRTNDWALRVFAIEKARGILKTPDEALCKIYETLTNEQKIAFILAGGAPSLLQHQPMATGPDTQTGQLPALC